MRDKESKEWKEDLAVIITDTYYGWQTARISFYSNKKRELEKILGEEK